MLSLARRLTWREYFKLNYSGFEMNTEISKGIQLPANQQCPFPRAVFFADPVPSSPGPILEKIGYSDHVKGENILEWPELSGQMKQQYYHDGPESTTLVGSHIWSPSEINKFDGILREFGNKIIQ